MARFFRICTVVAAILQLSSALECGEYTPALLHSRIVNGELAVQGEFPWQVSIQRRARARVQGADPNDHHHHHHPQQWDASHQIHIHPHLPNNPINQWPSAEEILDSTLWGKYFWGKLEPQNMTYMDTPSGWQGEWPPPIPTHGPGNTIPPLPTHPPSHTAFPSMPPIPTFPPNGHWPPVNNPSHWPPAIPGIPPNGQWPPPLPTHPPIHFPPYPTHPPAHIPTHPPVHIPTHPPSHIPSIPSMPTFPPSQPTSPPHRPTDPPTIPIIPSRPPGFPEPPNQPAQHPPAQNPPSSDSDGIHGGPNDPMQPVLPFPTRPPTHQPQPPVQEPFPPIPSRPQPQPQPPQQQPPHQQPPGQGPPPPPPQNPHEKWQHFCGGSIIDRQWILTAAHCIHPMRDSFQPGQLRIVAGSVDWRNYDPVNSQVLYVDRIAYHSWWTQEAGQHDIALLHLSQPLHYVKKDKIYVNRICLSNNISSEHSGNTISSGWGFLNKDQRQTPDSLRKVTLPVIPHAACKTAFRRVITISQMQVCAGQSPKGNCMGDSGSPLVQKVSDKRVVQLGIVSFSIPCATPGFPDVFTRVSKYLDWIIGKTGLSLAQLTR